MHDNSIIKGKFVSELGSICSHHSEKHFGKSKNSEQKYGVYISTIYVRTTSFAKKRYFFLPV